jgi:hypothetical protein
VTVNRQRMLGKALVALGCLWLVLILFNIQPLFLSLLLFGVWSKASNGFAEIVTVVSGREYVAALAAVALGLTVWRRGATGRLPLKMIFVVFALFIVGTGTRFAIKKRAAQKREATYQLALSEYQRALRPGMTRKEVEDYLRAKNAQFRKSNFAESGPNRHSFDDLTKIGEEDAPWFCGENNVYVAFYFVDHESSSAPGFRFKDDDLDALKSVSLYHMLEDCL